MEKHTDPRLFECTTLFFNPHLKKKLCQASRTYESYIIILFCKAGYKNEINSLAYAKLIFYNFLLGAGIERLFLRH